jgi:hypothetical protein
MALTHVVHFPVPSFFAFCTFEKDPFGSILLHDAHVRVTIVCSPPATTSLPLPPPPSTLAASLLTALSLCPRPDFVAHCHRVKVTIPRRHSISALTTSPSSRRAGSPRPHRRPKGTHFHESAQKVHVVVLERYGPLDQKTRMCSVANQMWHAVAQPFWTDQTH